MKFKVEKERLLQQFEDSQPMGMDSHDLEDVEKELDFMIEEGIDLSKISVRDLLERL